jgi:predicted flap endonuclease-1-like 5' DNA nuclease
MRHRQNLGAIFCGTALVLGLVFSARPARASHYAVADIPSLFSATDAAKLKKAGVSTTEELFAHTSKGSERKALAKRADMSDADLRKLAMRCDLLRIKGVGPEMVLLLEAAGVKTTADLAKQDPAALSAAANAANKVKKISEKPPTEPQFQDWIQQAKRLPPVSDAK